MGVNELQRTPLHVDFKPQPGFVRSEKIDGRSLRSKTRFNAIGSRVLGRRGLHLPILDVDGVVTQRVNFQGKTKTVLFIARSISGESFRPDNDIKEIFGDHGIGAEVHTVQDPVNGRSTYGTQLSGPRVSAITLTSQPGVIETVASTNCLHGHVFIQEPFSTSDHNVLLNELTEAGAISDGWRKLARKEGMGILRTPWTDKAPDHSNS